MVDARAGVIMRRGFNREGFSFIDAVLSMVLVSSSYLALGAVLTETSLKSVGVEVSATAVFLARGKMAQIKVKDFADIADETATPFTGDFSAYTSTVAVDYVETADLNTPVTGPTDYKRVEVVVGRLGWPGAIHLYDLAVDFE